jgi:hypothetical protein
MVPPIAVPAKGHPRSDHSATDVTAARRHTPSCSTRSACTAVRQTTHGRAAHQEVPSVVDAGLDAHEIGQGLLGDDRRSAWTGLVRSACLVALARSNAGDADMRSLCAPYWSVAIPYCCWRAREGRSGRHYGRRQERESTHSSPSSVGELTSSADQSSTSVSSDLGRALEVGVAATL